jgi:hypothetical protein
VTDFGYSQGARGRRLWNRVLGAIGNLDRCTPVREFHAAFKADDYITKLCRTQEDVILNHVNTKVLCIGQGEARHRKYNRLKLGGGQANDRSAG